MSAATFMFVLHSAFYMTLLPTTALILVPTSLLGWPWPRILFHLPSRTESYGCQNLPMPDLSSAESEGKSHASKIEMYSVGKANDLVLVM